MKHEYTPPVNKLLTYGDCRAFEDWPDYLALGFTEAHVPELIRMAGDEELLWAMSDSLEVWAPVHAWRTLGQLKAEEAVPDLLGLLDLVEENDDWAGEDIPSALAMIGLEAIPSVEAYISDKKNSFPGKIAAAEVFLRLHQENQEYTKEATAALIRCLENYKDNDSELNAVLISHAIDMEALEALSVIRKAFEAGQVDLSVSGDVEEVEIHFGVREKRSTPPPELYQDPGSAELRKLVDTVVKKIPGVKSGTKEKKIGRNDPCPCGSGKKYKKCCLGKKTK